MRSKISLLFLFILSFNTYAQESSIHGQVNDHEENPVFFASSVLYNSIDSSVVKLEYTDEDGHYNFKNIPSGSYWLSHNFVGFEDVKTEHFDFTGEESLLIPTVKFKSPSNSLKEVTITAQRPLLELKPDRVVMNVAGSINASGEDAYSLLRKSPGVVVDNNDNISMLGKAGVQIYIDGKPSPLSGTSLVNYLKTISSAQIDAIEIISNPSAKYDAEGSAGIINIKLVRDKSLGANGSIQSNISAGQKLRYGTTFIGNIREKKWSAYTSVGAYKGESLEKNFLYREQFGNVIDQSFVNNNEWEGINFRTGMDYLINDKNTLGVLFNYSPSKEGNFSDSRVDLSQVGLEIIDSILIANSIHDGEDNNWNSNLNYKYEDKNGRSLNLDLDYGFYETKSIGSQPNAYYTADEEVLLSEKNFETDTPTDISIATAKIDYEQNLFGGQLGIGVKFSKVITDNTFNFYNVVDDISVLDMVRSNQFKYEENVNAAYINYNLQLEKLGIQSGLRMEHTNSEGILSMMNSSGLETVKRDYLDFFPNLALSYQADSKNAFNFSYGRRLNRPVYQLLNPFNNRIDELTFERGNPFLNPEYSNTIQLGHSWNYKINTSLSYSHTEDLMTRIVDTEDEKTTFITWLNLESQKSYSINVSSPIPVTSWWNSYTSITGVQTSNRASFEEGKNIDLTVRTFNLYSQHSFNLPKDYRMEISGWYNSPSIWGGNFKMKEMYSIDFGIQKNFLQDKLSIKLGVSDIFRTQKWNGVSEFGELLMNANGENDSRRVKLNLSYRFGNDQLKNRKRSTGLEDEAGRIQ